MVICSDRDGSSLYFIGSPGEICLGTLAWLIREIGFRGSFMKTEWSGKEWDKGISDSGLWIGSRVIES